MLETQHRSPTNQARTPLAPESLILRDIYSLLTDMWRKIAITRRPDALHSIGFFGVNAVGFGCRSGLLCSSSMSGVVLLLGGRSVV